MGSFRTSEVLTKPSSVSCLSRIKGHLDAVVHIQNGNDLDHVLMGKVNFCERD
jgi:hypothetical protein